MIEVPLRSYVYYALCELSDASDNLDSLLSCLEYEDSKAVVSDILKDVESAISKLHNLSL